jgi:hypothetical protein
VLGSAVLKLRLPVGTGRVVDSQGRRASSRLHLHSTHTLLLLTPAWHQPWRDSVVGTSGLTALGTPISGNSL